MAKKKNGDHTVVPAPTSLAVIENGPTSLIEAAPMPEGAALFLKEAQGQRAVPSRVPIIGIDHRSAKFVLPSGELVEEISGYPVYYFQTRKFYKASPKPGEKGTPPDCFSGDCITPSADARLKQAATCAECPNSKFGTGKDGRSQACSMMTWVFLLNPQYGGGGAPPIAVIIAPPSSIRALLGTRMSAGYFAQAQARHGVYEIVWSVFGLEQLGDPRSVQYCVLAPRMGEAATDLDQCRKIAAVRNQFLKIMDEQRGRAGEAPVMEGEEA